MLGYHWVAFSVTLFVCYSYSSEIIKPTPLPHDSFTDFRTLQKPFRMAKLNVLWSKAQLRLTEAKLKSLYSELKLHDKEQLTWKKLKADGNDEDGLQEATMRSRLTGIMSTYGLLHHFQDIEDPELLKNHKFETYSNTAKKMFRDDRLNHMWSKAEKAGFSAVELQALKEEFGHHQDKVDQYYSLLNDASLNDDHKNSVAEDLEALNAMEDDDFDLRVSQRAQQLQRAHRTIKDGYDRLHRITAKGPNSKEFIEPQVQGLWRLALDSNFSDDELLSLKSELLHYENRLLKLRHLHAEAALNTKVDPTADEHNKIKKTSRNVEKLRLDLETKIMSKHIEL